jgi:hypothetical protein
MVGICGRKREGEDDALIVWQSEWEGVSAGCKDVYERHRTWLRGANLRNLRIDAIIT